MPSGPDYIWLFLKPSGRLGRAPYVLASLLILIVQALLLYRFTLEPEGTAVSEVLALAFMAVVLAGTWSNIALASKRFHDFGKPGTLAALFLIGGYLLVIGLAFIGSDQGPNRYGASSNSPT